MGGFGGGLGGFGGGLGGFGGGIGGFGGGIGGGILSIAPPKLPNAERGRPQPPAARDGRRPARRGIAADADGEDARKADVHVPEYGRAIRRSGEERATGRSDSAVPVFRIDGRSVPRGQKKTPVASDRRR
ncbi:MAG: hypothetical protein D6725_08465 [Planctomycetota bacterium]|nr:MAG: hypothetical protein D6725_08465 [Planctomycetota bacterium]